MTRQPSVSRTAFSKARSATGIYPLEAMAPVDSDDASETYARCAIPPSNWASSGTTTRAFASLEVPEVR